MEVAGETGWATRMIWRSSETREGAAADEVGVRVAEVVMRICCRFFMRSSGVPADDTPEGGAGVMLSSRFNIMSGGKLGLLVLGVVSCELGGREFEAAAAAAWAWAAAATAATAASCCALAARVALTSRSSEFWPNFRLSAPDPPWIDWVIMASMTF